MSRFSRYCLYALFSAGMVVVILGAQRVVMMPTVYHSIHQMGDRVGRVLPNGYTDHSRLATSGEGSMVSLVQARSAPRYLSGSAPYMQSPERAPRAGVDLRVPVVLVVMFLAVLYLVSSISLWGHRQIDFRVVPRGRFVSILALGSGVCVVLATVFTAARVFWTGVDQVFYSRAITQIGGGSSIRVQDNQLLAMGSLELVMMLAAMAMSAVPILYFIDKRLFHLVYTPEPEDQLKAPTLLSRIYEHELFRRRISQRSIYRLGGAGYVLVVVFLWTSPWSTTILHSLVA
jgi:hypothetical protein